MKGIKILLALFVHATLTHPELWHHTYEISAYICIAIMVAMIIYLDLSDK